MIVPTKTSGFLLLLIFPFFYAWEVVAETG